MSRTTPSGLGAVTLNEVKTKEPSENGEPAVTEEPTFPSKTPQKRRHSGTYGLTDEDRYATDTATESEKLTTGKST